MKTNHKALPKGTKAPSIRADLGSDFSARKQSHDHWNNPANPPSHASSMIKQ